MKITLLITTLAISLLLSPVFASNSTENTQANHIELGVGFGTGSVVGGLIAGPVGIVTGAFIGSLIGQNVVAENQTQHLRNANNELNDKLNKSSEKISVLEDTSSQQTIILNDAHTTIEKLLTQNQELKNHTLNFDIQFRTNSALIEKQYQQHLADLAHALNTTPQMELEVAGFADRMGDENYNMELSKKRAQQVKEFLVQHGINEDRIITLAHGESQPLNPEENLENNFFDRRVTVYLRPIEISAKNIAEKILAAEESLSVAKNEQ